jgi:hypothetical protein
MLRNNNGNKTSSHHSKEVISMAFNMLFSNHLQKTEMIFFLIFQAKLKIAQRINENVLMKL